MWKSGHPAHKMMGPTPAPPRVLRTSLQPSFFIDKMANKLYIYLLGTYVHATRLNFTQYIMQKSKRERR